MSENGRTVAITGSSGLVGRRLVARFEELGWSVMRIVRGAAGSHETEVQWDPATGFVNPTRLEGLDAVVHLAGDNIAQGRWNAAKKDRIRNSRIQGTTTLCEALAGLERKPRVLVSASATGFYGDRGTETLNEKSAAGEGFLADVCREWEAATKIAAEAGIRVVNLRIGVVLSRHGGALAKMLLPFKLGLGGRVGSGAQYWSWISLADLLGVILHAIEHDALSGPVNTVSPEPTTNRDFTRALGKALGRPTFIPIPAAGARIMLGEMAGALLLPSARVVPDALVGSGYEFATPTLDTALEQALAD